jgi:hypothetical protein
MVSDYLAKIKEWGIAYKTDIALGLAIFFISAISFGLGRISIIWAPHPALEISTPRNETGGLMNVSRTQPQATPSKSLTPKTNPIGNTIGDGPYVASKSGTAYYLLGCAGAKRIKAENLITFKTEAEAAAAGYKPAGNCPGLSN